MIRYKYKNAQLIFVGINPHPGSFKRGVPFSNNKMFWYLLRRAGLIDEDLAALKNDKELKKIYETRFNKKYGLGFINVINRPTRDVTQLENGEELTGQKRVRNILKKEKPKVVCFVGKIAFEKFSGLKEFSFGWQADIFSSKVFVMHFPLHGKAITRVNELRKLAREIRPAVFTIGHSTRAFAQFADLLVAHKIKKIVDIRTIPKSRHNPQFNEEKIKNSLVGVKIKYEHVKQLGGLRHAKKDSMNLGWRNASFRGFADYMQTDEFKQGLAYLKKIAQKQDTAIMCAEAVPWRCHRSLIADALTLQKWRVFHIQSKNTANEHKVTPFLKIKGGEITYPK